MTGGQITKWQIRRVSHLSKELLLIFLRKKACGDTSRSFSGYTVENVFHDSYQAQQMMDGLRVLIKKLLSLPENKSHSQSFPWEIVYLLLLLLLLSSSSSSSSSSLIIAL
jgi:hypothetical protein